MFEYQFGGLGSDPSILLNTTAGWNTIYIIGTRHLVKYGDRLSRSKEQEVVRCLKISLQNYKNASSWTITFAFINNTCFVQRTVLGLPRTAYEVILAAIKLSLSRTNRMWRAVGMCLHMCACVCNCCGSIQQEKKKKQCKKMSWVEKTKITSVTIGPSCLWLWAELQKQAQYSMQPAGMGTDTCYDPDSISVKWQLDQ